MERGACIAATSRIPNSMHSTARQTPLTHVLRNPERVRLSKFNSFFIDTPMLYFITGFSRDKKKTRKRRVTDLIERGKKTPFTDKPM